MSIRAKLEDATVLFRAGRREGAFVQVLIAAAAHHEGVTRTTSGTMLNPSRTSFMMS
jgi:hypothetical protein